MSRSQNDLWGMGATILQIGLSSVLRFQPQASQVAMNLKYISGGSLEIVQAATLTGPGWGTGYLLGTSEIVQINGPATFYLAATGATAIAHLMVGYASGASLV